MLTRDYDLPDRLTYSPLSYSRDVSHVSRMTIVPLMDVDNVAKSSLLNALVEAMPKGLIVLSTDRAIIYWNQNAKHLCQKLSSLQRYWTLLPTMMADLCEQVSEAGAAAKEPVILDYQTPEHVSFRLTACWLPEAMHTCPNTASHEQPYILVTVEDRDEALRQDIQVEQKKFHLTNREAEIWLLLKREYTYQAIATTLHISLNTVKTHIRNIHAKRYPHLSLPA